MAFAARARNAPQRLDCDRETTTSQNEMEMFTVYAIRMRALVEYVELLHWFHNNHHPAGNVVCKAGLGMFFVCR